MVQVVTVEPKGDGWAVRCITLGRDLTFESGARAEAAAPSPGLEPNGGRESGEIRIYHHGGLLAGRFLAPSS